MYSDHNFFFRKFRFFLSFLSLTLITIMTEKKFGIVYFQLFNGCWLAEIVSKSRKKLQQQDIFPPFFIWRPKTHKKPVMSVWELRAPMTVWIVRKRQHTSSKQEQFLSWLFSIMATTKKYDACSNGFSNMLKIYAGNLHVNLHTHKYVLYVRKRICM